MRRLALVAAATVALIGVGPATAGLGPADSRPSWCEENATAVAKVVGAGNVELVLGAGASRDRPVQSGYACVDAEVGRHQIDGIVTAWVDTQYGTAGWSCARQPSEAVTCKRRTVPLPGRASEPAGSSQNEWQLDVLGLGVAYDLGTSRADAATRTSSACVGDACADGGEHRAWARPGPVDAPGDDDARAADGESESDEQRGAGVHDTSVVVPAPAIPGD